MEIIGAALLADGLEKGARLLVAIAERPDVERSGSVDQAKSAPLEIREIEKLEDDAKGG